MEQRVPLIEHVKELRARLFWSLVFVVAGAGVGYAIHDRLLAVIQKPIGQTLYYTAPTGALTFIIKICVVFGLLLGLPAIMYNIFSFLGPLLSKKTKRAIVFFTMLSVVLATAGVMFSYFLTLPAALHFLVGFGNSGIKSLITANEYFNFAFAYIIGFAVLFQIPLVMLFINRIHRLPPSKLIMSIRYVIVLSFVVAAIITPTPDPLNQGLMALPAVALYLISIIVVIIINNTQGRTSKSSRSKKGLPTFPIKQEYVQQPVMPLAPAVVLQAQPRPAVVASPVVVHKKVAAIPTPKPSLQSAHRASQIQARRQFQRQTIVPLAPRPHALPSRPKFISDLVG